MARLLVFLLVCVTTLAHAQDRNLQVAKAESGGERRIALVIGNSAYKSSPLRNPVHDARAIAGALKQAGFDVTLKEDLNQRGLFEAAREFGNKLKEDGVALFYYAGHGMQVRDRNYLVPVEADIQSELEVPYSSLDVNFVMDLMSRARSRMNLVILDACRNNPFARSFRSAASGLAQMDAPGGTLLAYATAPGKVASDGTGENGLYTQYLLKHLPTPGLPVEIVFKRVREDVEKETKSQQVPWESSSVKGDFFFVPPKPVAQVALAAPAPVVPTVDTTAQAEFAFWDSIKSSNSAADYQAYLATYPTGRFAALARARVAAIERQSSNQSDSRDQSFWDSIRSSNNPAEYEAYLAQYPKGQYAAIARTRIEQFKRQAAAAAAPAPALAPASVAAAPAFSAESLDLAFWNSIQGTRIVDDYRAYLRQFPNGRFAELAKSRVEQLSAPPIASAAPAAVAPPRPAAPPPTQVASAAPTVSSFRVPAGLKVKRPEFLPRPGDSWTYKYTDPLNRPNEGSMVYEIRNVTDEGVEESFRRANQRTSQSTVTVEPGLRWVTHSGLNFLSPDFSPYELAYGALEEGKTVRIQVPSSRWGGDGQLYPIEVTLKGEENVTVPAGTFRARRIEIRGSSHVKGIATTGRQTDGGGTGVLRVIVDIWYAPSVKRYVKYVGGADFMGGRVDTSMFELVSYKVADSDQSATLAGSVPATSAAPVQVATVAPATGVIAASSLKLPLVGERWVYQYTDGWKPADKIAITHEVTDSAASGIEERVTARIGGRNVSSELQSTNAIGLREWTLGGISVRDIDPFAVVHGALKPGEKRSGIPAPIESQAMTSTWSTIYEVVGEEDVVVPAGKFRAIKVVASGQRSAPSESSGIAVQFNLTVWYVPEIKRYAKLVYLTKATGRGRGSIEDSAKDSFELVSYTPK